jgi:hypothetical protein
MPFHALVQVPGLPDREVVLPPGSRAEPLPSVLLSCAEAHGVVVEACGRRIRIRGRILREGDRWLLRPGESARVGNARIVARGDEPGTAAQARDLLRTALRGEDPDCGPGIAVLGGPDAGRRLPLRDGVLGRGPEAALRLVDPSLSRSHARIRLDGQRVLLEDLGSKNGLWVNGRRRRGVQELHPGEEVRAGRTVLALGVAASPEPPISPLLPRREGRESRRRMARAALLAAVGAAAAAAASFAPW